VPIGQAIGIVRSRALVEGSIEGFLAPFEGDHDFAKDSP